jgi:hypothetical protein
MVTIKPKDVIFSYLLGLWALLGYWVAVIPGLTGEDGWAFAQPLYILIPVLTLWYGSWFLLFVYIFKKVTR